MQKAKKGLIYLYCVANKPPPQGVIEGVYPVYHRGLYAIVSKVQESEFSQENLKKNLASLEWIKQKAGIHEKIIEEAMGYTCVIPFKFATIFNTEDSLKAMLNEHAEELKTNLKNLEGKEEWGVKIYCQIEKLKETLSQEDKGLLDIDKEINSSAPGKAYFLKKKKEDLLNTVVNKKMNEYGQESFERLSEQSLQSRINKLLPKEVTERKDDMILNSAFLVGKNRVAAFIGMVDILKKLYEKSGFFFDCTGPWPPYNFCQFSKENVKNG